VVGLGGKFAIEAEESLLIGRQRIDIDLVLLMWEHLGYLCSRVGFVQEVIVCRKDSCLYLFRGFRTSVMW